MKNIKYNLASDSWDGEEISAINDVIKSIVIQWDQK